MELKSPFKLSLIFLLVYAPVSVVQANPHPACNFKGFSAGIGLGAATMMSQITNDATLTSTFPLFPATLTALPPPTPGDNATLSANNNVYRYGAMGNLFVGYGQVYDNNAYLGAELGLNFFGARVTTQKSAASNNTEITYTDSFISEIQQLLINNALNANTAITRNSLEPYLDIKLGYVFNPSLLTYLKGGINYNKIEIKNTTSWQTNAVLSPIAPIFPGSGAASLEQSHSRGGLGYRVGAGMEYLLTPQIGLGMEYVYTFYRKVQSEDNGSGTNVACDALEGCQIVSANLANSTHVTVSDQEIMAQLIYHFG